MSSMSPDFSALQSLLHWMQHFPRPWFVAGGWAIDAFLMRLTREHEDLEIAIYREDQLALQKHLQTWQWEKVVQNEREPWPTDEYLLLPTHELHGSRGPDQLEVLLNERYGDYWVFRRNFGVTRQLEMSWKLSSISGFFSDGLPILSPEIILLYKAKANRKKDAQDFFNAQSALSPAAREWLKTALELCYPEHPWIQHLED